MSNRNMPAMPLPLGAETAEGCQGITKREMMAMHAMVGLLSGDAGSECSYLPTDLATDSVRYADAVLAELERTCHKT